MKSGKGYQNDDDDDDEQFWFVVSVANGHYNCIIKWIELVIK